ncbi:hypothetical protein AVEN_64766-1 [Araneus ventricosus]|uniref:Uncharacterized protein n=1 Tax=Araneus ventricosus TaxID=182803 RepID=A0A4Y2N7S2_ARAVE|nr:hypothetical protein AVEN_64766-1 [Araneus ventricosus]
MRTSPISPTYHLHIYQESYFDTSLQTEQNFRNTSSITANERVIPRYSQSSSMEHTEVSAAPQREPIPKSDTNTSVSINVSCSNVELVVHGPLFTPAWSTSTIFF